MTGNRGGRPEVGGRLTVRLGPLLPAVRKYATARGLTLATAVRQLIASGLAHPPAATRTNDRGGQAMTTTYGTWNDHGDRAHCRVEDTVAVYLGEFAAAYDHDGLVAAYRTAINNALPEGVSLRGNDFYGPYPRDHDLLLSEAVESVDLGELAAQYDREDSQRATQ